MTPNDELVPTKNQKPKPKPKRKRKGVVCIEELLNCMEELYLSGCHLHIHGDACAPAILQTV